MGDAALRDIEFAHYLDAGDDGGVVLFADGWHGLCEHAVNAELNAHRIVTRFNVDITGAPLQRSEDGRVHEPDDGTDVAGSGGQFVDGNRFIRGDVIVVNDVKGEAFAGFLEYTLRLFRLLQDVADLLEG